jgi:YebC/PmpR family DNA-binding regulatory protein
MAGHSHWAGIKHKKAAIDAKRGKLWSKLSKAIIVAARTGGGDVATNLSLRYAIIDAKAVSMPKDNIERAIKKGTGELEGGQLDEVMYEGYGPAGVAVMCEILTDNRNRTAPELRNLFERYGGNLGGSNCVAWMFHRKGLFIVDRATIDEESLMELALEAGADDVKTTDDGYEITCAVEAFQDVSSAIERANLKTEVCRIAQIPKDTVELDADSARKVLALMDALDDHDDVQNVWSNFTIPQGVLAVVGA